MTRDTVEHHVLRSSLTPPQTPPTTVTTNAVTRPAGLRGDAGHRRPGLAGDAGASWSDPGVTRAVIGSAVIMADSGVLGVALDVIQLLHANAGGVLTAGAPGAGALGVWAGLAEIAAYLVAAVPVAAWRLKRTDA